MREIKFRAWDKLKANMHYDVEYTYNGDPSGIFGESKALHECFGSILSEKNRFDVMQYTGVKDKNGKEIYEGDIIGEEGVYHFLEREGWKEEDGNWKIIGERTKNFTGKGEERYIAGYRLTVVEWQDSSCGFEPFSDSKENCGHCGGGENPRRIEVIGNIFENKKLLKR